MADHYDLAVIGAGSGGIAAALAAARLGLHVVLVEQADTIGGTMVRAGVHVWEMGVGGTGIPLDIYRRLKHIPGAVGIYSFGRHSAWPLKPGEAPFAPGGEHVIDPSRSYSDTLRRHGTRGMVQDEALCREMWHGVVIEPEPYVRTVLEMLAETGRCEVVTNAEFMGARGDGRGAVEEVVVRTRNRSVESTRVIEALYYIDATGDGLLCQALGAEMMFGQEARSRFGEPSAPEQATARLNGVTLIFRVSPAEEAIVEPLPAGVSENCWWREGFPYISATRMMDGSYLVNMLPTLEGAEYWTLGPQAAYQEARRRVHAQWRYMQTGFPEFRQYRLSWVAPMLGVRETRRVVGEYILTQHDLLAGISGQKHPDIIALADHSMDRHGEGGHCGELAEPYGIPYRCLIPKGLRNVLVGCRAASFSALAASSCRLTRTMMQLGQAAGTAAALAKRLDCALPDVPPEALREELKEQNVRLEWATS